MPVDSRVRLTGNFGRRASHGFALGLALLLSISALPRAAQAYSVLTHEELIDLAWDDSIRPLLVSRYPNVSESELLNAHAYAYGGAAIQDMGYYPFGKEFFSDLTHYVRTGDFVVSLFRNQRNVDELAFAVGALSHYLGDNIGPSECINPATAIEFPKLARKYGELVTYDESPHSHIRTEFAFDIDQLSHHRLAPAVYLRQIGLKVPRPLLERAFTETYGLSLQEVLGPERPAIRSYRSSARNVIPKFAHAETVIHGSHFPDDVEDKAFLQFEHNVSGADFQKHWAGERHHPGFTTHLLALLILIMPRIGDLSDLAVRGPNQQTEEWYVRSVDHTMAAFREILKNLQDQPAPTPKLENSDLDTGNPVRPGAYALTDKTYAELLKKLARDPERRLPPGLRQDISKYYSDPNAPIVTRRDRHAWAELQSELAIIRTMPVTGTDSKIVFSKNE